MKVESGATCDRTMGNKKNKKQKDNNNNNNKNMHKQVNPVQMS